MGDSVTTDHISPAGSFKDTTPAGKHLLDNSVNVKDFNSYGSRRGNFKIMQRGTFANIRLSNKLVPEKTGGFTKLLPDGVEMSIYDAAQEYKKKNTNLIIFAGKDYGCGSSRDWAAKGTKLLGVKAVIAESFERIHRSNLVGMGIMPLQFNNNESLNNSQTIGKIETGSISKICFKHIKNSKVFEFKPNDLTVNAAWLFLSQRLNFLSGRRISILGAGNIGSKLALKLVECGSDVHLYRRDDYKGFNISHGLNLIKPINTVSSVQFHQSAIQAAFMSDVVIGASSGSQIINEDIINCVKKDCIVFDLGKNNLSKGAINLARNNSLEIYRADVTPAIEAYVYEVIKMQDILNNSYGIKDLGFCNIVGGGYSGENGDIVVDNISDPKRIIGVSDGNGNIKKRLNTEDDYNMMKILKEFFND